MIFTVDDNIQLERKMSLSVFEAIQIKLTISDLNIAVINFCHKFFVNVLASIEFLTSIQKQDIKTDKSSLHIAIIR